MSVMEGQSKPALFAFPTGQPSSPPATPGTRSNARFPPQTSQTSPIYKRMGISRLAQSPPLEFIEPIGEGPHFHFSRPQSRGYSSRPSSTSGRACATSPPGSESGNSSADDASDNEILRPARRVETAEFTLEELDSDDDEQLDDDTEIIRPDHYEDATSEKGLEENGLISGISRLQCAGDESHDEEEQRRSYRRKKKRWSAGIFKRSHSQSVGSDSDADDSEALDAHDVGSSARRLRRRVRGPGDRSSLIFDEAPHSHNIAEVEEPDDIVHVQGPPSIPSDDGFTLDELPFWIVKDPMDIIELESSDT